jgi:hypothetical protein
MNRCRVGEDRGSKKTDGCPLTTTAPSAVIWMAIYGRLGTRKLGTVIFCISFVV